VFSSLLYSSLSPSYIIIRVRSTHPMRRSLDDHAWSTYLRMVVRAELPGRLSDITKFTVCFVFMRELRLAHDRNRTDPASALNHWATMVSISKMYEGDRRRRQKTRKNTTVLQGCLYERITMAHDLNRTDWASALNHWATMISTSN